jgi:hypothetical protein
MSFARSYEIAARAKKVAALVAVLREFGITAEKVREATDADWLFVAARAQCQMPSAQTIALVADRLAELEGEADRKAEMAWEDSQEYGGNRCPPRE